MKKRMLALFLAASLLLSGCSLLDGYYLSVTPHRHQKQNTQSEVVSVSNYVELLAALKAMIANGTEVAAINVKDYPQDMAEYGIMRAIHHILNNDALGSFAVAGMEYEIGSSNGAPALSVTISYSRSYSEIQRIRKVADDQAAEAIVGNALENYDPSLVLWVETYEKRDFSQFVQDYAEIYPNIVMETPQVTQSVYGAGRDRVVELIFTYQTSRDALRRMQSQVKPVFDAATLYVSGDGEDLRKYSQLYAFLMERFDYKFDASITPAYSLLSHGVGDSRAFATVYAAMCRSAGLECQVVTGTYSGEPRTWNIVCDNGQYFHVDLLRSNERRGYQEHTDSQMVGYVWDYTEYPVCDTAPSGNTEPTEILEN